METTGHRPRNEGQEEDLTGQSDEHGLRTFCEQTEIGRTQGEPKVEHQERQYRQNDENGIHK